MEFTLLDSLDRSFSSTLLPINNHEEQNEQKNTLYLLNLYYYFCLVMPTPLDLLEETLGHFHEGARSVRAYTDDTTYIITKANDTGDFWVATEEPSFPKTKTRQLETYFEDVFGVEARY